MGGLVTLVLLGVGVSMMSGTSASPPAAAGKAKPAEPSLYDFAATKMDGESVPMGSLAGKTVLMLNVASR